MTIKEELRVLNELVSVVSDDWFIDNSFLETEMLTLAEFLRDRTELYHISPIETVSILLRILKLYVETGNTIHNGGKVNE